MNCGLPGSGQGMTFSIAARCPRTGHLGVGALTAMAGVGVAVLVAVVVLLYLLG